MGDSASEPAKARRTTLLSSPGQPRVHTVDLSELTASCAPTEDSASAVSSPSLLPFALPSSVCDGLPPDDGGDSQKLRAERLAEDVRRAAALPASSSFSFGSHFLQLPPSKATSASGGSVTRAGSPQSWASLDKSPASRVVLDQALRNLTAHDGQFFAKHVRGGTPRAANERALLARQTLAALEQYLELPISPASTPLVTPAPAPQPPDSRPFPPVGAPAAVDEWVARSARQAATAATAAVAGSAVGWGGGADECGGDSQLACWSPTLPPAASPDDAAGAGALLPPLSLGPRGHTDEAVPPPLFLTAPRARGAEARAGASASIALGGGALPAPLPQFSLGQAAGMMRRSASLNSDLSSMSGSLKRPLSYQDNLDVLDTAHASDAPTRGASPLAESDGDVRKGGSISSYEAGCIEGLMALRHDASPSHDC